LFEKSPQLMRGPLGGHSPIPLWYHGYTGFPSVQTGFRSKRWHSPSYSAM